MKRRVPDLTKIKNVIGYEPTSSLEDILTTTIASIKDELENTG